MNFVAALPVLDPVSPQAAAISDLFVVITVACAFILAIVTTLVSICIIRFREKPGNGEPKQNFGNKRMEIAWTIAPFLLLVWMFFLTARAMNDSNPEARADREPDLIVVGHQWWWEVRYTKSGVITANEIHIPVGQKLLVRLESADVIHDFWAPQLGPKVDMVPGHPNTLWLQADKPGTYDGACAEFCGTQHAWMRFLVIAESATEFEKWEKSQLTMAPSLEARGEVIFKTMTCVNCHAINDGFGTASKPSNAAPDLTHFASRRTIGAGVIENNPANLKRWLKNPQLIKLGSKMPDLALTDEQVDDLVKYFETLK